MENNLKIYNIDGEMIYTKFISDYEFESINFVDFGYTFFNNQDCVFTIGDIKTSEIDSLISEIDCLKRRGDMLSELCESLEEIEQIENTEHAHQLHNDEPIENNIYYESVEWDICIAESTGNYGLDFILD